MILHLDGNLFRRYVIEASEKFGLDDFGIVEKDYYITLFLKNIVK